MMGSLAMIAVAVVVGLMVVCVSGLFGSVRRRRESSAGAGMSGPLGELVEVFHPTAAHFREEIEYKRLESQEVPGTAPGGSIDLDDGKVVLVVPDAER